MAKLTGRAVLGIHVNTASPGRLIARLQSKSGVESSNQSVFTCIPRAALFPGLQVMREEDSLTLGDDYVGTRYACYFLGPFHTADVHRHRARAPLDLFPRRRRFLINHGRQSQVARVETFESPLPSVGHSIVVLALHSASDLLKEGDRMKLSPFPFPFLSLGVSLINQNQNKANVSITRTGLTR